MFEIYIKSIIKLMKATVFTDNQNFDYLKQILTDLFLLLSKNQNNYLIIGESASLLELLKYLFSVQNDITNQTEQLKNKVDFISLVCPSVLAEISKAYSFH